MKSRRKEDAGRGNVQIGTSSLLLIFTVLCLVIFTVLSLTSAKADHHLAEKNMDHVRNYYVADGKAEELVRSVNEVVMQAAGQSAGQTEFETYLAREWETAYQPSTATVTYQVDVDDEQFLLVSLQIFPRERVQVGQKNYSVLTWVVHNKVDYPIDERLPVWTGEFQ